MCGEGRTGWWRGEEKEGKDGSAKGFTLWEKGPYVPLAEGIEVADRVALHPLPQRLQTVGSEKWKEDCNLVGY